MRYGWLNLFAVAAVAFLPLTLRGQAVPSPDRLAAARELIAANRVVEVMLTSVRANLSAQKAAMPAVPPAFWTRFTDRLEKEAPALADSIAVLYAEKFTLEELRQLLVIARSPIGRKMVELQPAILSESTAIGQRWGGRIGAEVAAELRP